MGIQLFDAGTGQWSSLARTDGHGSIGYMCWSRTGDYLYFNTPDSIRRVSLKGRKVTVVSSLKDVHLTETLGEWLGLAPDDSPLVLRDASIQEIYALDVSFP